MKTVLITGVGRGIGKALTDKFLAEGYSVIGTVFNSGVPDLASDASGNAHTLKTYQLNLSSPKSIAECADNIKDSAAKIDILINNSGVLLDGEYTTLNADLLRKTLEVNLIGTADFTEQIIPAINKGGHIVFLSSQAGSLAEMQSFSDSHAPYHYPAYKISKTAVNMYACTLALRMQHEKNGTIISCVHPGWVRTDMGGPEATTTPEEASNDIFKLAVSRPETGQFWYKGEKYPW